MSGLRRRHGLPEGNRTLTTVSIQCTSRTVYYHYTTGRGMGVGRLPSTLMYNQNGMKNPASAAAVEWGRLLSPVLLREHCN